MSETQIHQGNWSKRIFSTGKWYLLSSLLTKGLSLLLLPVYTRYLNPTEYGILNTLNSLSQFLPILMSLYLDAAFGRFFHEMKLDQSKLSVLFSSVFWFVCLWGGLQLFLVMSTGMLWVDSFLPGVPYEYFILAIIPTLMGQLSQLGTIFLRQSLDSKRTTLIDISGALISVAVTVPLLIFVGMGVKARLFGIIVPTILVLGYYIYFFRKQKILTFHIDSSILKKCLFYSIPLIPNIAGGWITSLSDRLVLAKYADLKSVGLYSLAFNLGQMLYLVQDAITQVSGAVSMSGLVHDKEQTKKKMAELSLNLWAFMLVADLALSLVSPELVDLLATRKYSDTSLMIGIVAFAYVLSSQYRIFCDLVSFHQKTWVITVAGFLMAATSLGLNLLLVPHYGYIATAWSFIIATAVYTFWIVVWAQKFERIQIQGLPMFLLFLFFVIGQLSAQSVLPGLWQPFSMGIRLCIFLTFSALVWPALKLKKIH